MKNINERLPAEVLLIVFEYLAQDCFKKEPFVVPFVCKYWAAISREPLVQQVHLASFRKAVPFLLFLNKYPETAHYLEHLEVVTDPPPVVVPYSPQTIFEAGRRFQAAEYGLGAALAAVRLAPNLCCLRIRVNFDDLPTDMATILDGLHHLYTLILESVDDFPFTWHGSQILADMMPRLANLRHLTLSSVHLYKPLHFPPALEQLDLLDCEGSTATGVIPWTGSGVRGLKLAFKHGAPVDLSELNVRLCALCCRVEHLVCLGSPMFIGPAPFIEDALADFLCDFKSLWELEAEYSWTDHRLLNPIPPEVQVLTCNHVDKSMTWSAFCALVLDRDSIPTSPCFEEISFDAKEPVDDEDRKAKETLVNHCICGDIKLTLGEHVILSASEILNEPPRAYLISDSDSEEGRAERTEEHD